MKRLSNLNSYNLYNKPIATPVLPISPTTVSKIVSGSLNIETSTDNKSNNNNGIGMVNNNKPTVLVDDVLTQWRQHKSKSIAADAATTAAVDSKESSSSSSSTSTTEVSSIGNEKYQQGNGSSSSSSSSSSSNKKTVSKLSTLSLLLASLDQQSKSSSENDSNEAENPVQLQPLVPPLVSSASPPTDTAFQTRKKMTTSNSISSSSNLTEPLATTEISYGTSLPKLNPHSSLPLLTPLSNKKLKPLNSKKFTPSNSSNNNNNNNNNSNHNKDNNNKENSGKGKNSSRIPSTSDSSNFVPTANLTVQMKLQLYLYQFLSLVLSTSAVYHVLQCISWFISFSILLLDLAVSWMSLFVNVCQIRNVLLAKLTQLIISGWLGSYPAKILNLLLAPSLSVSSVLSSSSSSSSASSSSSSSSFIGVSKESLHFISTMYDISTASSSASASTSTEKSINSRPPLSFSFSGCGWLLAYHVGVGKYLLKHQHLLDLKRAKFSGSSSGAVIAAAVCLGADFDELSRTMVSGLHIANGKLLGPFGCQTKFITECINSWLLNLPEDAYKSCNDRLFISVTHLATMRNYVIHRYESNEHLRDTILASCYIPFYNERIIRLPVPDQTQRKLDIFIDGALTNNQPLVDAFSITISPSAYQANISPGVTYNSQDSNYHNNNHNNNNNNINNSNSKLLDTIPGSWRLFPPTAIYYEQLIQLGEANCRTFLQQLLPRQNVE